ncbi:hypothetical protein MTO96_000120 [Rhipicephalus appendiculatus]
MAPPLPIEWIGARSFSSSPAGCLPLSRAREGKALPIQQVVDCCTGTLDHRRFAGRAGRENTRGVPNWPPPVAMATSPSGGSGAASLLSRTPALVPLPSAVPPLFPRLLVTALSTGARRRAPTTERPPTSPPSDRWRGRQRPRSTPTASVGTSHTGATRSRTRSVHEAQCNNH